MWEALVAADGNVYYFNTVTRRAQWESPLPAGWQAAVDGDRVYFVDVDTGATQWEFPSGDESTSDV